MTESFQTNVQKPELGFLGSKAPTKRMFTQEECIHFTKWYPIYVQHKKQAIARPFTHGLFIKDVSLYSPSDGSMTKELWPQNNIFMEVKGRSVGSWSQPSVNLVVQCSQSTQVLCWFTLQIFYAWTFRKEYFTLGSLVNRSFGKLVF